MSLPQEYLLKNGTLHMLARDIPVDASYSLRINFATNVRLMYNRFGGFSLGYRILSRFTQDLPK